MNRGRKVQSSYIREALDGDLLNMFIKRAIDALEPISNKFDTIAFRGYSGGLVAPAVAAYLGKDLIIVRKDNENCHTSHSVEGFKRIQRYIIIDDFTETGATLEDIINKAQELNPKNRCAGAFFYRNSNTLNDAMICQGLKIKHWNKYEKNKTVAS